MFLLYIVYLQFFCVVCFPGAVFRDFLYFCVGYKIRFPACSENGRINRKDRDVNNLL